jgi:glycosyltransferase involved in cell wall biosynthesis
VTVLALVAASEITGPLRSLFQLIKTASTLERPSKHPITYVVGVFIRRPLRNSLAIEELKRRGITTAVLHQRWRFDPLLFIQVWRLLRRHKVSLIQTTSYKAAVLGCFFHRLTGIPWVALAEGYTYENRWIERCNRLEQWLLRSASCVVTVSKPTGELLLRTGVRPERLRVIGNAIDPGEYQTDATGNRLRQRWGIHDGELAVGVIARFSPEKGHAVFLEAFQQVLKTKPNVVGVFIGDGPERPGLLERAERMGLMDRIRFVGYQTDVSSVYAALTVVVIPSLNEGLPLVMLEALLHGKPVVATAVGGLPEILGELCPRWLVPPGDPIALGSTIVEALENEASTSIASAAPAYVKKRFSAVQRAMSMFSLYGQLHEDSHALIVRGSPATTALMGRNSPELPALMDGHTETGGVPSVLSITSLSPERSESR